MKHTTNVKSTSVDIELGNISAVCPRTVCYNEIGHIFVGDLGDFLFVVLRMCGFDFVFTSYGASISASNIYRQRKYTTSKPIMEFVIYIIKLPFVCVSYWSHSLSLVFTMYTRSNVAYSSPSQ